MPINSKRYAWKQPGTSGGATNEDLYSNPSDRTVVLKHVVAKDDTNACTSMIVGLAFSRDYGQIVPLVETPSPAAGTYYESPGGWDLTLFPGEVCVVRFVGTTSGDDLEAWFIGEYL